MAVVVGGVVEGVDAATVLTTVTVFVTVVVAFPEPHPSPTITPTPRITMHVSTRAMLPPFPDPLSVPSVTQRRCPFNGLMPDWTRRPLETRMPCER